MSDKLREALKNVRAIISEAAMTGFNWKDGDWVERLFASQAVTSAALAQPQNDAEAFPQAWRWIANAGDIRWTFGAYAPSNAVKAEPLYTAPPPELERMRKALEEALAENKALRSANTTLVLAERDRLDALANHASDGVEGTGYVTVKNCKLTGGLYVSDTSIVDERYTSDGKECQYIGPCGWKEQPSDPTPAQERREEIARIIDPAFVSDFEEILDCKGAEDERDERWGRWLAGDRWQRNLAKADRILALPPSPKGEPSDGCQNER